MGAVWNLQLLASISFQWHASHCKQGYKTGLLSTAPFTGDLKAPVVSASSCELDSLICIGGEMTWRNQPYCWHNRPMKRVCIDICEINPAARTHFFFNFWMCHFPAIEIETKLSNYHLFLRKTVRHLVMGGLYPIFYTLERTEICANRKKHLFHLDVDLSYPRCPWQEQLSGGSDVCS